MKINTEIKEILREFNISISDGTCYLVSIYFDCVPSYIPIAVVEKINRTGILSLDSVGVINWNIPLFEEQITNFEWVKDWLLLFAKLDKTKAGNARETMLRMKKFFITNIGLFISKDEVMEATEMYIKTVKNPTYLITAKYFISKGAASDKTSSLLEWIERLRRSKEEEQGRISLQNTMQ